MTPMRVAVIGAGPAGLGTIKQLADFTNNFTIVGFERGAEIGGQWLYSEKADKDEYGLSIFSSMYDRLLTNIPCDLMTFPDFAHTETEHSYLNRHQIFKYLQDYADFFQLRQYIKFKTLVTNVRPLSPAADTQWEVTYCYLDDRENVTKEVFDSVLVCHGHNDKPRSAEIPELDKFKGLVMHSHMYRKNTPFVNKRIVLLGGSFTGMDLSLQLSEVASKIFLAHKGEPLPSTLPDAVTEKGLIKRFTENTVVFDDDTEEEVDAFILCIGFENNINFLRDVVKVTKEHVVPIYKHVVHIEHPTLMFVGLPRELAYFPLCYENARFIVRCLLGMVKLPSKKDMYEDDSKWLTYTANLGYAPHKARYLGKDNLQWIWNEELAELGGFPPLPPVLRKMWGVAIDKLLTDLVHFREYKYNITGRDSFEIMQAGKNNKYE